MLDFSFLLHCLLFLLVELIHVCLNGRLFLSLGCLLSLKGQSLIRCSCSICSVLSFSISDILSGVLGFLDGVLGLLSCFGFFLLIQVLNLLIELLSLFNY